jgi:hypothetical protein
MVALPISAASAAPPKPDLMMNGTSEPKMLKSMTSQKYPAAISATTRLCSGEIFASSRAALTKPSMVCAAGRRCARWRRRANVAGRDA